jgi:hypothetical protein
MFSTVEAISPEYCVTAAVTQYPPRPNLVDLGWPL